MQLEEAKKLRETWGDKPCDHPNLSKEYHFGAATGDYTCTQCGKAGWGRDWNEQTRNS
jgi:hypothetical protein